MDCQVFLESVHLHLGTIEDMSETMRASDPNPNQSYNSYQVEGRKGDVVCIKLFCTITDIVIGPGVMRLGLFFCV